jgi:hypothetical protein
MRDVQRRDRQGWDSLEEVIAAERAVYRSLAVVAEDLVTRLEAARARVREVA